MDELNRKALARDKYVALVGDSVFDNKAYVPAGHDVQNAVYRWRDYAESNMAYLAAVDGAVMKDVAAQPESPEVMKANKIYISIGGNDLLRYSMALENLEPSVYDLYEVREKFRAEYRANVIDLLVDRNSGKHIYNIRRGANYAKPVTLCTIYIPKMILTNEQQVAEVAVSLVNDVIITEAGRVGLQVLELRNVMSMPEHFTMEIEPSMHGSDAIAQAIEAHTSFKPDAYVLPNWPRYNLGRGTLHKAHSCSMCMEGRNT